MDAVVTGAIVGAMGVFIGATVAGGVALWGGWKDREHEIKRARHDHANEIVRAEAARVAEEKRTEAAHAREIARAEVVWTREVQRTESEWFREKVLEAYSGCIYYSIRLGMSAVSKSAEEDGEVRRDYSEAHRYLLLLRAYTTDSNVVGELTKCSDALDKNWSETNKLATVADAMAKTVGSLLKEDPRLKSPNLAGG